MEFICKECQKDFESRRSLHAHLKAHFDCVGDYYVKYFPKYDLLTGERIPFFNYDLYMKTDFMNYSNFKSWIKTIDKDYAKKIIKEKAESRFEEKNIKISPPDLFYKLSEMADIEDCKELFGSYCNFLEEVKVDKWFDKNLPKGFWDDECEDLHILIDTREQQPLNFSNSIQSKLDFGDYTASGDKYSKTFIDRKAAGDFCSTFSGGIDRFKREMDRCVAFDCFMFVVVESSVDKLNSESKKFVKSMPYVWHNVKEVIAEYPKNVQFVFAHSRGGAQKIIPKILQYGDKLWNVDVQYFLDKRISGKN